MHRPIGSTGSDIKTSQILIVIPKGNSLTNI